MGETEEHWDYKRVFGSKHTTRACHDMYIGLLVIQWICLHFGLEHYMCISCIGKAKYASKVVHCQVTDIPNFEFWRLCPHLELYDFYLVSDDWRFVALVKGVIEHLDSVCVKLVGEAWPFECERHFCALTAVIFQPASIRKVQRRVKNR